jgi:site-specific DNA recombinase
VLGTGLCALCAHLDIAGASAVNASRKLCHRDDAPGALDASVRYQIWEVPIVPAPAVAAEAARRHNVCVTSIAVGIDAGIQNEQYLRSLGKSVFRGQEGVVLDALCVGDCCFGYCSEPIPGSESQRRGRNPKPKKRYAIKARHAVWVRRIFRWFVVEMRSLRWITQELNRRGAPKHHRATTKNWRHSQIAYLLKNTKYVGRWPWGKRKNVRQHDGKIGRELRATSETAKWDRDFPQLRIIDDEMFDKAQARLQANEEVLAKSRSVTVDKNGGRRSRLTGSTSASSSINPRHLLSGLIICECGRKFHVSGNRSRYMFCPGYQEGACPCQTMLRRDLAEQMILNVIGHQILADATLRAVMLDAAVRNWDAIQRDLPDDVRAAEIALAEVDRVVTRLLDKCEREDVPELEERLSQRRAERETLRSKLAKLRSQSPSQAQRPTAASIDSEITKLKETLRGGGPAAAIALRNLVGGQIKVQEVRRPDKQRHYLQGRFTLSLYSLGKAIGGPSDPQAYIDVTELAKEIVIDFREPEDYEALADVVMADFEAGLTIRQIAAKHECSRGLVDRARAHWYTRRGETPPDGRGQRARLQGHQPDELGDRIMVLWHQDVSNTEIAARVGCSRDTITAKVKAWHEARRLPVPDGRARRKQLRLKREQGGVREAA